MAPIMPVLVTCVPAQASISLAHPHHADLRARRHAALIKLEAEELLRLGARQELRVHRLNLHDPAVGLQLDGLQLRSVMRL